MSWQKILKNDSICEQVRQEILDKDRSDDLNMWIEGHLLTGGVRSKDITKPVSCEDLREWIELQLKETKKSRSRLEESGIDVGKLNILLPSEMAPYLRGEIEVNEYGQKINIPYEDSDENIIRRIYEIIIFLEEMQEKLQ